MHSRHPCPRLLGRLDYTCAFSRTESRTYTVYSSTSSITGLDDQLGQINVTTLSNPGLSGFTFQPGTSPYFPSGLILTNSHQRPIPSVSYNSHACSENFIHHQQDVTFRPIHIQWPSSPPISPVLVQSPVVSTPAIMGYSNPVGCGLPHIPPLVPKTKCDDRCSVTSSGTQPVLLHGCISQRMGRQLERPSDFRPMVRSGIPASYQLAGTGSHTTCATSLGTSVAKSIGESLLRQQYGSSVHPQTGRNTFSVLVSQNSRTVRSPGSVCDNSSPYTSSRSQERYGRCSVPNQSTQPNRMAHPNLNLEQSVLCLRNSPDRHVCHSGEQGHARLCFSLPGRQSMGGRRPVPILGRFGTSLCVSSGSHCPQNSPENPKISRHHGHHDCVTTSIPTVAPSSSTVEHTSLNPSPGRQPVPVCAQPQTPPISPRSKTIGSSCVEIIRDILKSHHFPDTVVDISGRTRQNFQARALGAFHGRVSSAARAWGHKFSSEAMHVYMGENRFSLWSYHIGTVFKSIQLSFYIYRVSNHHLVYDIHQMISELHNLYKFQWAITSCLFYVECWPGNIKTVPAALWWLMWHSNTLHPPSESCISPLCVMIMSQSSEGGFRQMYSASWRQQAITL